MSAGPATREASTETLARAMFALLVLATVAAFFVTQRLKSGTPVVQRLALQRYVSPNGDGLKDRARIAFYLPKGDTVTVDVLDSAGDRVRRLVDNVHLARGRHSLSWTGHADDGHIVRDGEYFVRVILRGEGRAATSRRGILVVDTPPRPRLLSVTPSRVSAHRPGPFTFAFTGPSAAPPVFRIWRTGGGRAVQVATLVGRRRHHDVRWSGLIGSHPVRAGTYAVSVTVRNRALVPGSSPRTLPPTAAQAMPGTGFEVVGTTAVPPLEPVRAGSVVRIPVQGAGRHLRYAFSRFGSTRPLRRGRAVGALLAIRVPPRASTGEYVVRVVSAGRPAQVPVAVAGRGSSPVLVVLPTIAWEGANPVDDDADGFPDTLFGTPSLPLGRPFAQGRLPAGLVRQAGPLLDFLQRRGLRFELTTDLALARGRGPKLAGHRGVLLAGDETWISPALGGALRAYVEAGGRVASFGGDSLLRRVTLTPTTLTGATPRAGADIFGEAIAPAPPGPPAPLVASSDAIGLFAGTNGVVGPFPQVEQSQGLPPGARSLVAAGRDPRHPALVAYQLGRGTVIRVGVPDWAGSLASSSQVAAVTARAWSIISR
jgi:FlgD Ig-like domain